MKKLIIKLIRLYQQHPKGLACRFEPTCSEYMILAIEKYGLFKGLLKGLWRIMRCNPWGGKGIDYP